MLQPVGIDIGDYEVSCSITRGLVLERSPLQACYDNDEDNVISCTGTLDNRRFSLLPFLSMAMANLYSRLNCHFRLQSRCRPTIAARKRFQGPGTEWAYRQSPAAVMASFNALFNTSALGKVMSSMSLSQLNPIRVSVYPKDACYKALVTTNQPKNGDILVPLECGCCVGGFISGALLARTLNLHRFSKV